MFSLVWNLTKNAVEFLPIEITSKNVWGKNMELRPAKLYLKKYVEKTWIFWSVKLHRKGTWKWRGNSSKFCHRHIDVILIRRRLGYSLCRFKNLGIDSWNYQNFWFSRHFWKYKESHRLQVSATKLLGDYLGNIKMPNWFLDKASKKDLKQKKWTWL